MANVFKNAKLPLSDTLTDIYTVPAATTAIVFNAHVANVSAITPTASAHFPVDLLWTDSSDSDNATYIAKNVVVPYGASYEPISKLILEAGDKLRGNSSASASLEITLSILEQS